MCCILRAHQGRTTMMQPAGHLAAVRRATHHTIGAVLLADLQLRLAYQLAAASSNLHACCPAAAAASLLQAPMCLGQAAFSHPLLQNTATLQLPHGFAGKDISLVPAMFVQLGFQQPASLGITRAMRTWSHQSSSKAEHW